MTPGLLDLVVVPVVVAVITAGPAWRSARRARASTEAHGEAVLTAVHRLDGKVDLLAADVREVMAWRAAHDERHTQPQPRPQPSRRTVPR